MANTTTPSRQKNKTHKVSSRIQIDSSLDRFAADAAKETGMSKPAFLAVAARYGMASAKAALLGVPQMEEA